MAPDPAHPVDAVDVVDKNHFLVLVYLVLYLQVMAGLVIAIIWPLKMQILARSNIKYSNDEYIHHNTSPNDFLLFETVRVLVLYRGFFPFKRYFILWACWLHQWTITN